MLAEVDRLPAGTLETILEYRYLARAIAIYDQDPTAKGALVAFVRELDFERAQEELDQKKHRDGE